MDDGNAGRAWPHGQSTLFGLWIPSISPEIRGPGGSGTERVADGLNRGQGGYTPGVALIQDPL